MPLIQKPGKSSRVGDSGHQYSLEVEECPDGDIWVRILCNGLPLEERVNFELVRSQVEFVQNHPRSPRVMLALRELRAAMEADNQEQPIE